MPCLFCTIIKSEKGHVIYEDKDAVALLDIAPRAPGHTMVIPRAHAAHILELADASIAPLFLAVKRVVARLGKALSPQGFTIGINHGKIAGQAIDHLHIHILPRFKDDGGSSIHFVVDNPPKESLAVMAERIRGSM